MQRNYLYAYYVLYYFRRLLYNFLSDLKSVKYKMTYYINAKTKRL